MLNCYFLQNSLSRLVCSVSWHHLESSERLSCPLPLFKTKQPFQLSSLLTEGVKLEYLEGHF